MCARPLPPHPITLTIRVTSRERAVRGPGRVGRKWCGVGIDSGEKEWPEVGTHLEELKIYMHEIGLIGA